jgi:uncharacterized protein (DUF433 family)
MNTMRPTSVSTESWIQSASEVCGGEPRIRNTRYTIAGLVAWRQLGLSDVQIREHHPDLTSADLTVAWSYYEAHAEEIDRVINEVEEA